jgi:hypothetical protein
MITLQVIFEVIFIFHRLKASPAHELDRNEAGFPKEPRYVDLYYFHQDGGNVLGAPQVRDSIRRVFKALDAVREMTEYDRVCATSSGCAVHGVVDFWNESLAIFEDQVSSNADAVTAMSAEYYPGGTPVVENSILRKSASDHSNLLVAAESITVRIDLPDTNDAEDFKRTPRSKFRPR